jgi:hypothetical protein
VLKAGFNLNICSFPILRLQQFPHVPDGIDDSRSHRGRHPQALQAIRDTRKL